MSVVAVAIPALVGHAEEGIVRKSGFDIDLGDQGSSAVGAPITVKAVEISRSVAVEDGSVSPKACRQPAMPRTWIGSDGR